MDICWNGAWMDEANAWYTWTVNRVSGYASGVIARAGDDVTESSGYPFARMTPAIGGTVGRMTMNGDLRNVANFNDYTLTQLLSWICHDHAKVALVVEQQDSSVYDGTWQVAVSAKFVKMSSRACPDPPPGITIQAGSAMSGGGGLRGLVLRMAGRTAAGNSTGPGSGEAPEPLPEPVPEPVPQPPPPQCACNCTTSAADG